MARVTLTEAEQSIPLDYPFNALVSYHYFHRIDLGFYVHGGLSMIGDSGAFSARSQGAVIDPDLFYAWADQNRHLLAWVAALDVIGDEAQTWENWRTAPEHLRLVPTVHYGCDARAIDRYAERGCDLIGLGGMVPFASAGGNQRLLRWTLDVFRYARKQWPDVRFHGWGVSNLQLLMDLPWWSVDASSFGSGYRYGQLRSFDPRTASYQAIRMDGHIPATHARFLRDVYGVSWKDVLKSGPTNRRLITRLGARSAQLLEQFLQRRHRVPPPARFADGVGPRVHFADSAAGTYDVLVKEDG